MHTLRQNITEKAPSIQKQIGFGILGALMLCCLLYVYFLGSVIFDVVARKNAESMVRTAQANVGALELEYFEASKTLTIERARELGFVEDTATVFASRTVRTASAALSGTGGEL